MSLSHPTNYIAQLALLAAVVATSPNCGSESPQWGTVSSPDATKSNDATKAKEEVAAKVKITCASSAETCGHSINPNTCDSVDKEDFSYELSVETEKLLKTLEKVFQSIEKARNLTDLSSMVEHKSYSGYQYAVVSVNTGEFYGHIEIGENLYDKGITEITLFINLKSDEFKGEKGGPSVTCHFDANGKPLEIFFMSPISINPSAQCVSESTIYELRGDYSAVIDKDPYTISKNIMRNTEDPSKMISDTYCNDCDSTPINCDFSGTILDIGCDSSPIAAPYSTWKTSMKRKIDPQVAQSLLEKLTGEVEQLLKKHNIHP